MKNILIFAGILVLLTGVGSCNLLEKITGKTDAADTEKAVAPAASVEGTVGEGLSEEEATALLREEKVLAGTGIGKDDLENELLRIEEEIRADIEGREPDFANAGVKPELKPLVAKETFTPDNASSTLDYDRDMVIMKMMRQYIAEKKAEQEKAQAETGADSTAE